MDYAFFLSIAGIILVVLGQRQKNKDGKLTNWSSAMFIIGIIFLIPAVIQFSIGLYEGILKSMAK